MEVDISTLIQPLAWLVAIIIFIKVLPLILQIVKNKYGIDIESVDSKIDEEFPYVIKNIMTPTELKLYLRLIQAFPEYLVFSQVQLSQVLDVPSGPEKLSWWNKINRMSLDFVICDKVSKPVCVIELDDSTHLRKKRVEQDSKKDKALKVAGIKIVRIKVKEMPTAAELPKLLEL